MLHNLQNAELGEGKVPPLLDLELNTGCNLRCEKCFQRFAPVAEEVMDLELVERVITEFAEKGGKSLKLIYRGEPLLFPMLPAVIRFAKDKGVPRVIINTNGTLLDGVLARELIESGLDQISFSIDSSCREGYKQLHHTDEFLRVKRNITGLQLLKRLILKSKTPKVVIHCVRQEGNKKEVDSGEYERFWKSLNLGDAVEIKEYLDLSDGIEDHRKCKEFGCEQPFERMVVLVNGAVIPCCSGYNYVDRKAYSVGNVKEKSLEELWNGGTMVTLRLMHTQGKSHRVKMCRMCRGRKQFIDSTGGAK